MKKFFAMLLCAISIFAIASCCNDENLPPDSYGFYVDIFNKENGDINRLEDLVFNINVSLRNDDSPSKPLCVKNNRTYGGVAFYFAESDYHYIDVIVASGELEKLYDGKDIGYYIVINDPESKGYNTEYETKKIYFRDCERGKICNVYLKKAE